MKCPICDEELKGTEAHCPVCAWDSCRKPSAFLFVVFGVVILCVAMFVGIRLVKLIREEHAENTTYNSDYWGIADKENLDERVPVCAASDLRMVTNMSTNDISSGISTNNVKRPNGEEGNADK